MPLMSGLRKFSWTLKSPAAKTASCMSVQPQVVAADGVPLPVLVLVGLGLAAVDALDPRRGATEVTTVVRVVDRRVAGLARDGGVLGRGDEVLPGQIRTRLLHQVPQGIGKAPQSPLDVVVPAVVGLLEVVSRTIDARARREEPRMPADRVLGAVADELRDGDLGVGDARTDPVSLVVGRGAVVATGHEDEIARGRVDEDGLEALQRELLPQLCRGRLVVALLADLDVLVGDLRGLERGLHAVTRAGEVRRVGRDHRPLGLLRGEVVRRLVRRRRVGYALLLRIPEDELALLRIG